MPSFSSTAPAPDTTSVWSDLRDEYAVDVAKERTRARVDADLEWGWSW